MEEGKKKSTNPVVKNILQAFVDAGTSTVKLAKDPIGGQTKALDELGPKKTFNVSILFMLFFACAVYLLGFTILKKANTFEHIQVEFNMSAAQFFKLLLFSFVPFIMLFLTIFGSTFLSKEKHDISTSLFVTGLISVPLGLFLYVLNFVYPESQPLVTAKYLPVAFVISIFMVSFAVLLLNASFTEIYKLSSRLTMILIPSVYTLSGFLSYLLYNYFLLK